MTPPIALTIAGSDSGGGAGIQADLRTFQAFGCYGTSVITAVTAQNTRGVSAIHPIPPEMVSAQIDAVASDLPPGACKTGMLATPEIVAAVATAIARLGWPLIVDPVLVATSGDSLATARTAEAVRDLLVPLALCVTPNLAEAGALTGIAVHDIETMIAAGESLVASGARSALIKGGHLDGDRVIDVLVTRTGVERWEHRREPGGPFHGTGCTLSAALTAGIARGLDLSRAARNAVDYVVRAIAAAPRVGGGSAPLGVPPIGCDDRLE